MLAVIGGTGLTQLSNLDLVRREVVRTPFGEPSAALTFGRIGSRAVVFLARHGYGHTIPPHRVNYRANIWALAQANVTKVVSIASVGAIRRDLSPGALLIPHQLIDYTWGREHTFHEHVDRPVVHIDFTEPYDSVLREELLKAANAACQRVVDGAVYAATQGPRLESAAEIDRLERDGADIVGMTGMPEAALAREAGLAYAAIAVVANQAAGRGENIRTIEFARIKAVLQETMVNVRTIIDALCREVGSS